MYRGFQKELQKYNLTSGYNFDKGAHVSFAGMIYIYFENVYMTSSNESEAFPLSTLFAKLSSNVGLYMGISVVTVFEFIELLISAIFLLIKG